MKRPWPALGRSATKKKNCSVITLNWHNLLCHTEIDVLLLGYNLVMLCTVSSLFCGVVGHVLRRTVDVFLFWRYPTCNCFYLYSMVEQIQGEHKNTPWFQVVVKSKLTGIFLQNWWLQLHKLIQFHVVSHTHSMCPPSCWLTLSILIVVSNVTGMAHLKINKRIPDVEKISVPPSLTLCLRWGFFCRNFCEIRYMAASWKSVVAVLLYLKA
jgi:hypothetical protein